MNSSEKFCLQWNDFQNIVSSAFGDLKDNVALTYVTLACEDGKQMEAHKVVLAATSPFFLDLLKKNKHPHPLIYMKGTKSDNLAAMLDFFYRGEANVSQENLEDFLLLADELRLKGLSGLKDSQDMINEIQNDQTMKEIYQPKVQLHQENRTAMIKRPESQPRAKRSTETALVLNASVQVGDVQLLNEQIRSMMEKGDNRILHKRGNGKVEEEITRVCKVCGKEGRQITIEAHIEANHITGITHTCDICGNKATTKRAMYKHKHKYHREELN